MKPGPLPFTFTLAASGINSVLYVDNPPINFEVLDFTRDEWLNSRISNAMDETTYAKPIIQTNAVNAPVQVAIEGCGFSNSVPVGPETPTTLANALQRQNIKTYKLEGYPSSPSYVNAMYNISVDHKKRLDKFNAYLASLQQNISYQDLLEYRNETFSYLTTTGLSMTGLNTSENNCIISDFVQGIMHFSPSTSTVKTYGWSMTIQIISFQTRFVY